jgi:predicted ester cyclase
MSDEVVERNKENFRRLQEEVVVRQDMTHLAELVAPEFKIHHAASDWTRRIAGVDSLAGTVRGHSAWAEIPPVPNHRRVIEEIYGEGNVVWARFTTEHTHHDDRFGVPPTGKLIRFTEAIIAHYDDEARMTEAWAIADPFEVLDQIGGTVKVEPAGGTG